MSLRRGLWTTVPWSVLTTVALGSVVPAAVVAVLSVRGWRYPEPNVVNGTLAEATVLVLPVMSLVVAQAAARFLAPGILWHQPARPRASTLRSADTLSLALAAGAGAALGLLPLVMWDLASATAGPGPLPWWLVSVAAVTAAALLTIGLVCLWPTPWVGAGLAAAWMLLFYRNKLTLGFDDPHPTTRLALLPFAGTNVRLSVDIQANPRLLLLRLLSSVAVGLLAWGLVRATEQGHGNRGARPRRVVRHPLVLAGAAALAGLALVPAPLVARAEPAQVCRGRAPTICLAASHIQDEHLVREVYGRMRERGGAALVDAPTLREDARPGSAEVPVALTPSRLNSAPDDIASSLASWAVGLDTCLDERRNTSQTTASQAVARWLVWLGAPSPERSPSQEGPERVFLERWAADPAAARAGLAPHAQALRRCALPAERLP